MTSIEDLPLHALLDSAPDGFMVVDGNGTIVWLNQRALELLGYQGQELLGTPVEIVVPDRLQKRHRAHRSEFSKSPHVRPMGLGYSLLARRKDGSEFPVEISLSPLRLNGETLVTAIIRDVTDRKRMEDERKVLEIELSTERERDRIAMDLHDGIMQDIYAATLSLELSLALTGQEEFADAPTVKRAAEQLRGVIRDIRSYIFNLRPREFEGDLVQGLTDLVREFRQNSQIETELDIDLDRDVDVPVAVAILTIAHECLSNIQKHARAENVRVRLWTDDSAGHLEIADDGVGFDPQAALSTEHRGTRNMPARAASVGATFRIESAKGEGTRAYVDFPLAGYNAREEDEPKAAAADPV